MLRVILHGCCGSMGQAFISHAATDAEVLVVAGVDPAHPSKPASFPIFKKLMDCPVEADVVIDFSAPSALPDLLEGVEEKGIPVIIGTTGYSDDEQAMIRHKSLTCAIFRATNLSRGESVISDLARNAAVALGEEFDIEITDKHHRRKVDAPSGTAYALADAINKELLQSKHYIFGRYGRMAQRSRREIAIHAIRGGSIVGEHEVLFAGDGESVIVKHIAHSNHIFAVGAIRAARFMLRKSSGYYTMKDLILENSAITNVYMSDDESLITLNRLPDVPQTISRLFKCLGEGSINIDMISQTAPLDNRVSISFTLSRSDADKAMTLVTALCEEFAGSTVDILRQCTKITVEGAGMERQSGVASRIFDIMAASRIPIKSVTTSETKISYVIGKDETARALEAIQQTFGI
jgi:4-hydroxy-tetrahydrodipicolinate reductase